MPYEGDDDTAAVSADEWYEDDDPDPGVLADGRLVKIPSETRDRLWVYGYFTLKRMIRDGEIFEKCAAKDRAVRPSLDDLRALKDSVEDRDALAGDTLTVAMKKVGETWSTWSPERGAKLETYFIGGLTLHFPAVFRQWQRNRWRLVFVPAADAVPLALRAAGMSGSSANESIPTCWRGALHRRRPRSSSSSVSLVLARAGPSRLWQLP